jgi:hypothetical protein
MSGLAYLRRRTLQPPPGLVFEEDDPAVPFEGLRLSERLAAEARPPSGVSADGRGRRLTSTREALTVEVEEE